MSLLLKALEKSEGDNKEEGQTPPEGAKPEAQEQSSAGMKLSGGAPAAASKLGSALGAGPKPDAARSVVAAHAEEPQAARQDDADALVAASRKSLIKNLVTVVVVVIAVGVGWFAWQEYGSQFLPGSTPADAGQAQQEAPAASTSSVEDATMLPLNEPIYDIQESISLTSAGAIQASGSSEDEDIQEQVAEVVSNIIESQLDKQREFIEEQRRAIELEQNPVASLEFEVNQVLSQEFDPEDAALLTPYDEMVARLEALGSTPHVAKGGREFIKPAGSELPVEGEEVALEDSGSTSDDTSSSESSDAAPAKEVMVLAKSHTDLKVVFDDAVASYRAGDLNHAEKSFRTVIASEPRNTAALVGLAKVHQSRGNVRIAAATLLKAAEIAPDDPVVIGELLGVQSGTADPLVSESRIRALISRARNNDVQARLRFLLGNAYAKQNRWLEAKDAFFIAHGLDQTNPDIAYNLAVILDYLNEPQNAIRMYNTAISLAAAIPSSFDQQSARDRVVELSSAN